MIKREHIIPIIVWSFLIPIYGCAFIQVVVTLIYLIRHEQVQRELTERENRIRNRYLEIDKEIYEVRKLDEIIQDVRFRKDVNVMEDFEMLLNKKEERILIFEKEILTDRLPSFYFLYNSIYAPVIEDKYNSHYLQNLKNKLSELKQKCSEELAKAIAKAIDKEEKKRLSKLESSTFTTGKNVEKEREEITTPYVRPPVVYTDDGIDGGRKRRRSTSYKNIKKNQ